MRLLDVIPGVSLSSILIMVRVCGCLAFAPVFLDALRGDATRAFAGCDPGGEFKFEARFRLGFAVVRILATEFWIRQTEDGAHVLAGCDPGEKARQVRARLRQS